MLEGSALLHSEVILYISIWVNSRLWELDLKLYPRVGHVVFVLKEKFVYAEGGGDRDVRKHRLE